jgi:DNA-binding beta-propeller fold protein YncE
VTAQYKREKTQVSPPFSGPQMRNISHFSCVKFTYLFLAQPLSYWHSFCILGWETFLLLKEGLKKMASKALQKSFIGEDMKSKTLCSIAVMILVMAPLGLSAKILGMVADNSPFSTSVTVFDADTHAVLGTVPILSPFEALIGDVLITPDLKRGFVTNYNYEVFVIDLTTLPPSLAAGTNPIPISNAGGDLSISPDGKFLVVAGEAVYGQPMSVIDIAAQAEISTFSTDADTTSVYVCSDGSVLVTSWLSDTVRRLTLSATGTLTDTGEVLSVGGDPRNVYCAPGAQSGVVIRGSGGVTSFTIPGLAEVDTRLLNDNEDSMCGAINPAGHRVFVRSTFPGSIDVFDFNPATGALGASPLLTIPVANADAYNGIEQIALHPNGGKLFVPSGAFLEPNALNVYNPDTGALLASMTDPAIMDPTGLAVVTEADPCAGPLPAGAIVGTNGPNQINGTRGLSSNWTESRVKPSSCYERGPWGRLVEILRRIAQRP